MTATPAANSTFSGWSGGGCSGTGTCSVAVTANTTVTATFTLNTYTLSVTTTGTGTVTSSPAGITCGADCSEVYGHGTAVTLTAAAGSNQCMNLVDKQNPAMGIGNQTGFRFWHGCFC